jgi:hypothetical protein
MKLGKKKPTIAVFLQGKKGASASAPRGPNPTAGNIPTAPPMAPSAPPAGSFAATAPRGVVASAAAPPASLAQTTPNIDTRPPAPTTTYDGLPLLLMYEVPNVK